MRSFIVLACAAAGMLGGGALISIAALGACLIFVSLAAAAYAVVTHDWPEPKHAAARPPAPVPIAEFLQRKAAENW